MFSSWFIINTMIGVIVEVCQTLHRGLVVEIAASKAAVVLCILLCMKVF